ncbi:hypothetical protein [Caulobacter sp. NIBR1757]|uniref:hypothetical protein n=1 Tax=Caulobacter sp. NIBR1757 TaxID=3016000 RepID=UPI0022EFE528|nr:hypothetical protein [Caulobacter sp. NIBR1757]WGM40150.1 hypothetical protein AMEJIAPC_03091 [Caulobacter sp. NIBR1757]
MTRSRGIYGEAEAVVDEALTVECETRWETDELTGHRDRRLTDHEQVGALWKAVVAVRNLATSMQSPSRRDNPWGALGVTIANDATDMLKTISDYKVADVTIVEEDDD